MNETFRIRRSIQMQTLGATAFLLLIAISCSSLLFITDSRAKQLEFENKHAAVLLGCLSTGVFGFFILLSVYTLAACHIEKFAVAGSVISVRSVFQNHNFEASAVDLLRWRHHKRRLEFHVAGRKAILDLFGFRPDEQLKIIRIARSLIPEAKQQGWPLFCHRVALPLRESVAFSGCADPLAKLPAESFVLITRKRYDRVAIILIPSTLAVAIGGLRLFAQPVLLVIPLFGFFWYLMIRYSTPPQGRRTLRIGATPEKWAFISMFGLIALLMSPLLAAPVLGLSRIAEERFLNVAVATVAVLFIPIMHRLVKLGKKESRGRDGGIALAVESWETGEKLCS